MLIFNKVPPQYAGLCMALSSVSVVLSSMALKLYRRPKSSQLLGDDGPGLDVGEVGLASNGTRTRSHLREVLGLIDFRSLYTWSGGKTQYTALATGDGEEGPRDEENGRGVLKIEEDWGGGKGSAEGVKHPLVGTGGVFRHITSTVRELRAGATGWFQKKPTNGRFGEI